MKKLTSTKLLLQMESLTGMGGSKAVGLGAKEKENEVWCIEKRLVGLEINYDRWWGAKPELWHDNTITVGPIVWGKLPLCHYNSVFITQK